MDQNPETVPIQKRYEALGQFIASYEFVLENMRTVVTALLRENGLRNKRLGTAVTARLHAHDIIGILASLLHERSEEIREPILEAVLKNILKRVDKLGTIRNKLAHGFTFSYGWSDDKKDGNMGFKWEHTKTGVKQTDLPLYSSLLKHIEEARELASLLNLVFFAISYPEERSGILERFRFAEAGHAYYDPELKK